VTGADGAHVTLADLIASRGRDALVERLRKAYADAAAAHSDIVSLDAPRIESLVQAAADRADGLQWRRALAEVASQELGVSLAEALTHPAVREAQEKIGAPSYEASLAELVSRAAPPPGAPTSAPAGQLESVGADGTYVELLPEPAPIEQEPTSASPQPQMVIDEPEAHGVTGELEAIEADDEVFELLPSPEPIEYEVGSYEAMPDEVQDAAPPLLEQVPYAPEPQDEPAEPAVGGDYAAEQYVGEPTQVHALDDVAPELTEPPARDPAPSDTAAPMSEEPAPTAAEQSYGETYGGEHTDYPPPQDDSFQVLAYHLGGVANLPTGREGLGLRLSESGLDILQPEGEIIGRLHWNEIDALEVIAVRRRLRRQARSQSRIIVRTKHGDASFEIPGLSSEDLQASIEPLVNRYGSA
jgi:hypothetical protein